MAQDLVGAVAGHRPAGHGDPDADPDHGVLTEDRERHPEDVDQPPGYGDRMTQVGLVDDQDGELIPAQTSRQVSSTGDSESAVAGPGSSLNEIDVPAP